MPINARLTLASLVLAAAAPFGCSEQTPVAETVAPPTVSTGPATEASPTADPAVRPASIDPATPEGMPVETLKDVERKADGDVRDLATRASDEKKKILGETQETTEQARLDARKMIERAKRSASDKEKAAEGEIKKEANDLRKEVVEGLLGDPKN